MNDNITAERANEMITWPGEALDEIERYRVELERVKAQRDAMREVVEGHLSQSENCGCGVCKLAREVLDACGAMKEG